MGTANYQPYTVITQSLQNNASGVSVYLPATLANATLSFAFTLAGVYVTSGIGGNLTIQGQNNNGRISNLAAPNLATTDTITVSGIFTNLIFSLVNLTGCDTVVISINQYQNVLFTSSNQSLDILHYKGTYNASTNTPTLVNGTGNVGDWYLVTVGGSNNPTGNNIPAGNAIVYNGFVWQDGGSIGSSDDIVVALDYVPISDTAVAIGQSLTTALGALQGSANALAAGKQNLIVSPTANDVAITDSTGQTLDSGIAISTVTHQGNTFNGALQLVQTTGTSKFPALDAGTNTLVIDPTTSASSTLNTALSNIYTGGEGNVASVAVTPSGHVIASVVNPTTTPNISISTDATNLNTPSTVVARDSSGNFTAGTITADVGAAGTVIDPTTTTSGNLNAALSNIFNSSAGTVSSVASTSTDLSVANPNTNVQLTINSGTAANQLVKLTGAAKLPAVDSGTNTTVIDPTTSASNDLNTALFNVFNTSAGTVSSVSSVNADIGVANPNTNATLTLNSGVAANQIVKLTGAAKLPAVDSGANTTVLDPTTTASGTLNTALANILAASGGTGTVTNVSSANTDLSVANPTTTPVITVNSSVVGAANALVKLDSFGDLGAIDIGSGLVINPVTGASDDLDDALLQIFNAAEGINLANIICVDNGGSDTTGTGSVGNPYATITKGLSVAIPGSDSVWVFPGTYTETLTAIPGVPVIGVVARQVFVNSNATFSAAGTYYWRNLELQINSGYCLTASGSSVINLQFSNVNINSQSGASGCINWTNTNAGSGLQWLDSVADVFISSGGAKVLTSPSTAAGTHIWQYVTANILDNNNNTCIALGGSLVLYHTSDVVVGQIVVNNTAAYNGTFLQLRTGSVAFLVTNSSSLSSINSCAVYTSSSPTVSGAGGFVYALVGYVGTGIGFSNTLNGGAGAVAAPLAPIKIDQSTLPTLSQNGLVNYDGTNFYLDTQNSRFRIPLANSSTGILPAASLPAATASTQGASIYPLTTSGDLFVGGASGVPARLGIGSNGQNLTVTGGALAWGSGSGFVNPMTTTGDMIMGGTGGAPFRLGIGTSGQVLTTSFGAPQWVAAPLPTYSGNPVSSIVTGTGITGSLTSGALTLAAGGSSSLYAAIIGVSELGGLGILTGGGISLGGNTITPINYLPVGGGIGSKMTIAAEFINPNPTSGSNNYSVTLRFQAFTVGAGSSGTDANVTVSNPSIAPAFGGYILDQTVPGNFDTFTSGTQVYSFTVKYLGVTDVIINLTPQFSINQSISTFFIAINMGGWLSSNTPSATFGIINKATLTLTQV